MAMMSLHSTVYYNLPSTEMHSKKYKKLKFPMPFIFLSYLQMIETKYHVSSDICDDLIK